MFIYNSATYNWWRKESFDFSRETMRETQLPAEILVATIDMSAVFMY